MSRACAARSATSSAHREVVAGRGEIGIVVGGQHRDGENAQAAFARLDRRLHGLRIGVHGEERGAEPRRRCVRLRRPCCRCRGVSDRETPACRHRPAPAHRRGRRRKRADSRSCRTRPLRRAAPPWPVAASTDGTIERDDQAFARLKLHRSSLRHVRAPARPAGAPAPSERRRGCSSLRLSMSSNASRGIGDADLLGNHQRAAAEFENLPQRHQRAHAAVRSARCRADGKHAVLERLVVRLAAARADATANRWCFSGAASPRRCIRGW